MPKYFLSSLIHPILPTRASKTTRRYIGHSKISSHVPCHPKHPTALVQQNSPDCDCQMCDPEEIPASSATPNSLNSLAVPLATADAINSAGFLSLLSETKGVSLQLLAVMGEFVTASKRIPGLGCADVPGLLQPLFPLNHLSFSPASPLLSPTF